MSGHYDLKRSGTQYMFNLKAGNGEIILTSERYEAKASAHEGIHSVQANCKIDGRYERKTSSAGQPYFVLKAANDRTIGTSEMYSSSAARDHGIDSVKANGTTTDIRDNT